MIYLIWYLGIGAIIFVVVSGEFFWAKKKEASASLGNMDEDDSDRKNLLHRIAYAFVVLVLSCIALMFLWPVAIFTKVKVLLKNKSDAIKTIENRYEFAVRSEELQERLSIVEIENRELVTDPLGAVPAAPFGHLHQAWKAFLDGMGPGDTVWSYSATWNSCGRKKLSEGYVIVNGDSVGKHFQTFGS